MAEKARFKILRELSRDSINNKRVLLRADFNVPIGNDGKIGGKEDWRTKAALPTIKYLIKNNAKVIIIAHLGRPGGRVVKGLRLAPIKDKLSRLLKDKVIYLPDCKGKKVRDAALNMKAGEIILLENLRFYKEEEKNDPKFAKNLAGLGEFYVNDAFSDSHRAHASIAGISKYLPSYAGLLFEREIDMLEKAQNPLRPAVAIIGGAKLETKLPAVKALSEIYDFVLVGGMIANEIISTKAVNEIRPNVILPALDSLLKEKYFDIGADSVKKFAGFIQKAKTIIWNGPMGKFEDPKYELGTKGMVDEIRNIHAKGADILIGGGETIYAVQVFAPELVEKEIKSMHISTGGGAMLDFLAGKELPGIKALKIKTS